MAERGKKVVVGTLGGLLLLVISPLVQSHCEVPCGIYGDPMRLEMMAEHIQTIEKSMQQMDLLAKEQSPDYNQIVRWTMNKEHHADELSNVVTQYFMKQRIKPVDKGQGEPYDDYVRKLRLLHKMMVASMKCKQTTDLKNVAVLKELLNGFAEAYTGKPLDPEHSH